MLCVVRCDDWSTGGRRRGRTKIQNTRTAMRLDGRNISGEVIHLKVRYPTQRTTHCAERSYHHHHPVILLMASPLTYMNNHTERAILPIGYRTKTQYTVRLFGATPLQRHRNNAWKHLSWSSKDACYKPGFAFHACERGVESSFQSVTV
jgi:hypothetical protein